MNPGSRIPEKQQGKKPGRTVIRGKAGKMETELTMLEKIKKLLSIPLEETGKDDVLNIMIADAEDAIKGYCHIRQVPGQLDFVVRELVMNGFRNDNGGNVASIKRGDTQINYSTAITAESFTDRHLKVLNGYRKLRTG